MLKSMINQTVNVFVVGISQRRRKEKEDETPDRSTECQQGGGEISRVLVARGRTLRLPTLVAWLHGYSESRASRCRGYARTSHILLLGVGTKSDRLIASSHKTFKRRFRGKLIMLNPWWALFEQWSATHTDGIISR